MQQEITIEQLLRITAEQLSGIPVPVKQFDAIGVPIRQAIDNIGACLNAFERSRQQTNQEQASETAEPEIEIADAEVVSENSESAEG